VKKIKTIFTTITVLLLFSNFLLGNDSVKWFSFDEGMLKAKEENKLLLVDFYTDWCVWCKRMDSDTYSDERVINFLNSNFILVKLNPEKEGSLSFQDKVFQNAEFAGAAGVRGYPATGFFTSKEEFITLVPGYKDAEGFLELLKLVTQEVNNKES